MPDAATWTGPWLGATRRPSLQRVANRPIVCHVLDALISTGVDEVAILSPPDAHEEVAHCVARDGPSDLAIRHIVDDRPDDGAALAAVLELVGGQGCVLHWANGLIGAPLAPHALTVAEEGLDALLLVDGNGNSHKRLHLVAEPTAPGAEGAGAEGSAGVCLLAEGALARLAAEDGQMPPLRDFAAITSELARSGARTSVEPAPRWRQFSGDALDLLEMNRTLLDAIDYEAIPNPGDGNRFEGPILVHPTARVSSSVIVGPVIIGEDALIVDSYIGPHTSIAERVRIEGVELERSIVLADASVLHVGGRLVASVVGREARIFRDFSMPRALRLQVGDGDEVALC